MRVPRTWFSLPSTQHWARSFTYPAFGENKRVRYGSAANSEGTTTSTNLAVPLDGVVDGVAAAPLTKHVVLRRHQQLQVVRLGALLLHLETDRQTAEISTHTHRERERGERERGNKSCVCV